MNKKLIIFILFIFVITGLIVFYFNYIHQPIPIDPSRLGSVNLNGQTYETTGSIPLQDTSSRDLLSQIVKLANMGDITQQNFKISVDNNGKVQISLNSPFDSSKQAALKWLKDNGFNLITEDNILFVNLSTPKQ